MSETVEPPKPMQTFVAVAATALAYLYAFAYVVGWSYLSGYWERIGVDVPLLGLSASDVLLHSYIPFSLALVFVIYIGLAVMILVVGATFIWPNLARKLHVAPMQVRVVALLCSV